MKEFGYSKKGFQLTPDKALTSRAASGLGDMMKRNYSVGVLKRNRAKCGMRRRVEISKRSGKVGGSAARGEN